jgi:hypothetical protein
MTESATAHNMEASPAFVVARYLRRIWINVAYELTV